VPTITLEADTNGAPHPGPSAYAKKFSGKYQQRTIGGVVRHNLPQEAPEALAKAVIGWGFAQFKDGKPADEALLKTCFPRHEPSLV
jgi:hypothetical protein